MGERRYMKKFKYNLPKGYLSYSAMMLWIRNPELYRARYYRGEKGEDSVPMIFGKKIAEVLEKCRDKHLSPADSEALYEQYPQLRKVPFYPIAEQPLTVTIEEGLLVKGFLDLFDPVACSIGEVKTGSVSHVNGPPWDKVKVQKHEQLPFYSLMVKATFGKVDPIVKLIWLETRYKETMERLGSRMMIGEGRDLELTGRMEVFERRIAEWERTRIKKLIIKVAREITNDYDAYCKEKNIIPKAYTGGDSRSDERVRKAISQGEQKEGAGILPIASGKERKVALGK